MKIEIAVLLLLASVSVTAQEWPTVAERYSHQGQLQPETQGTSYNDGHMTYQSDGSVTTQYGSSISNSNGDSAYQVGGSVIGSDGSVCTSYSNVTVCN